MQPHESPGSGASPPQNPDPAPFEITPDRAAALNDAVIEAGVRFVGVDNNELVFEIQRKSGGRPVPLEDIAKTARDLLMDATDRTVQDTLSEAAAKSVRLKFY